jgi:hypothetical protein
MSLSPGSKRSTAKRIGLPLEGGRDAPGESAGALPAGNVAPGEAERDDAPGVPTRPLGLVVGAGWIAVAS